MNDYCFLRFNFHKIEIRKNIRFRNRQCLGQNRNVEIYCVLRAETENISTQEGVHNQLGNIILRISIALISITMASKSFENVSIATARLSFLAQQWCAHMKQSMDNLLLRAAS